MKKLCEQVNLFQAVKQRQMLLFYKFCQLNKVEHRHEPCGISRFVFYGSDLILCNTTLCSLSRERYDFLKSFEMAFRLAEHVIQCQMPGSHHNPMSNSCWFNASWIWFKASSCGICGMVRFESALVVWEYFSKMRLFYL